MNDASAPTQPQLIADPAQDGVLSAALVAELCQQYGLQPAQLAQQLVPFATNLAQPVISNYQVGAVAIAASGAMYYGANLEFPGQALSFTVHAEQAATTNAWNHGEQGLEAVAVSAAPCGYCRQFLWEVDTAPQVEVYVTGEPVTSLSPGLLPAPFGPSDLGITAALMAPQGVNLQLDQPDDDPVVQAALLAAELSYAPYTTCYAGVALLDANGTIRSGRLAENAAYNPSMSPLEAALAMAAMAGTATTSATRVVLVELDNPKVSQVAVTTTVSLAIGAGYPDVRTASRC